ncbi:MAG TPA: zinc ribbon domain-containing protein [Thermoplasmata archaeon]|nr:zinc ribbon domain-containing protein [Thermoplasmata archaeon]
MYCQQCGKEIPSGSPTCPACGFNAMARRPTPSSGSDSIEHFVSETKKAAKELAAAAATLSQRVVDKAAGAARNPPASVKRATRKAAEELEKAAREIDRIIRDL